MFITFEGIEGSGKTTQISRLISVLSNIGYDCIATREPGSTKIGESIRSILLDPRSSSLTPMAELFLYEADRAQHLHEVIRPALQANKIVISDRFSDATTVYQGYARGESLGQIFKIHKMLLGDIRPDLTLVLDLPVHEGLERAWARIAAQRNYVASKNTSGQTNSHDKHHQAEDRFEQEDLSFHEKVRDGYLRLASAEPGRFRVVDASLTPDKVHQKIIEIVLDRLPKQPTNKQAK